MNNPSRMNDREIANKFTIQPIEKIAEKLGLKKSSLETFGPYKAKLIPDKITGAAGKKGKLVMVTAMSPTPAGEGKTTTSIGLADALSRSGLKATAALREPSLGPVFGMKGGATGGGYAQVMPRDEINLHFTGDIHAITSAHTWKRVMDMDDRVLREIVVGIGGPLRGIARETGFDITAASEVMAILCLSKDIEDLKNRLGKISIGYSSEKNLVFAEALNASGAMTALLRDAIRPNLVQTLEGTPVFIHGGPFANIAHGTNSIIATRMALDLADIVVTESGFGSDLGAEKFFDIVVRTGHIPPPDVCILVATIRALKYHGGIPLKELVEENTEALEKGFDNLRKHIENMKLFNIPLVVAVNRFPSDTDAEIEKTLLLCKKEGIRVALSEVYALGGEGGIALANEVLSAAQENKNEFQLLYPTEMPLVEKIETIAKKIYGASAVAMEGKIRRKIRRLEKRGFGHLPVCIAKTQYSLSADDQALGRPRDFTLIVTDVSLSSGAGFLVAYCGDVMTMPGLPKSPAAENINITTSGEITGLS